MNRQLLDFLIDNSKKKHWAIENINIKDLPKDTSFLNHFHGCKIPDDIEMSDVYYLDDGYAYCKKDNSTLYRILPNNPIENINVKDIRHVL